MKRDQPPTGIVVTWGKNMIEANGGLLNFVRHFKECCSEGSDCHWLHKCKNRPIHDIDVVYIILCNRVAYKLFFGGYETGEGICYKHDGEVRHINWPRMILAGPFEKAPYKIPMRGFRGFRYVYEPIF